MLLLSMYSSWRFPTRVLGWGMGRNSVGGKAAATLAVMLEVIGFGFDEAATVRSWWSAVTSAGFEGHDSLLVVVEDRAICVGINDDHHMLEGLRERT